MTNEREEEIWKSAFFVFDSSALLDFYLLSSAERKNIFATMFAQKLKDKLWIPSHVLYEYSKNREKVINKPITEKYKPLRDENLKVLSESIKKIQERLSDLQNKSQNKTRHPHLPQDNIENYLKQFKQFKAESEIFEKAIVTDIEKIEKEITLLSTSDDVQHAIEVFFKIGRYYKFEEILKIVSEGKARYEFQIPPGYKDRDDKEKKGTQIFGDLIIWKQILEFAKKEKKPIILIVNDTKEDWCHLENKNKDRIKSPREELIKEIYDEAGVDFWMYTQPQFLYLSRKYFNVNIEENSIVNLQQVLVKRHNELGRFKFRCDSCGTVTTYRENDITPLEFTLVSSEEKNMGPENEYQAGVDLFCTRCDNHIEVIFHIWEYPTGVENRKQITIENGELIDHFDFSIDFYEGEHNDDIGDDIGDDSNSEFDNTEDI